MDEYDTNPESATIFGLVLCGFIGQQKLAVKKHFGNTDKKYLYLSGWIVAAESEFGALPDQSMHERTGCSSLIEELYTFLKQADAEELGGY